MHLPTSFPRRLTGAAVLACAAALMPAAAFAATAALAAQRLALDPGPVPRHGRRDYHLRRLDLS